MGVKSIVKGTAWAAGIAVLMAGTSFVAGSAASAESKADKKDTSKRICRMITPTGSRMTTRICRTRAEWDKGQETTADGVLQHQLKNSTQYAR